MSVFFFTCIGILGLVFAADPFMDPYRYKPETFKKTRGFKFLALGAQLIMIGLCLYVISSGYGADWGPIPARRAKVMVVMMLFKYWPYLVIAFYGYLGYLNFKGIKEITADIQQEENEIKACSGNQLAFRQDYIDWLNASNWGVLNYEWSYLQCKTLLQEELKDQTLTDEQRKNKEQLLRPARVLSQFVPNPLDLVIRVFNKRAFSYPPFSRPRLPKDLWDASMSGENVVCILCGPYTEEQKADVMECYGEPNRITEKRNFAKEEELGSLENGYKVLISSSLYLDLPTKPKLIA